MSSGILTEKEMAELLAFRERARQISRLKAVKRREKKAEAGLRQTNLWLTEDEAKLVRRFVKFMRAVRTWRLVGLDEKTQKWMTVFQYPDEMS